jgi:hypothetical protein
LEDLIFVPRNDTLIVIKVGLASLDVDVDIVYDMVLSFEPVLVENGDCFLRCYVSFLYDVRNLQVHVCFFDVVVQKQ